MDIHSICRICLEYLQNGSTYDLFLVPGLAKKLCMCTSLSVEPQDGFPKNICGVCYTRLSDMADFQKLCADSVQKFQEWVANNTVACQPTFDILEAPATAPIEGIQLPEEEDVNLNFDPLLTNHKMEMLENEDDVFKMLETVDKEEVEEVHTKIEEEFISGESSEEDKESDDDFQFPDANDDDDSDSDDDKPLATRLRQIKKELKEDSENTETDNKDPKLKPKRKRIPAAERHLHRIIECHICHQKFKKTKNYEEHMKYHNDKLPFQCEVENCKRGDIKVGQPSGGETHANVPSFKSKQNRRSTSNESSSPERYRHRDTKKHTSPSISRHKSPQKPSRDEKSTYSHNKHSASSKYNSYRKTDNGRRRENSKSRTSSSSTQKKKPTEKLPYYRDEQRERDRLKRLYGRSRSRTPTKTSTRRRTPSDRRRVDSPTKRRRSVSRDRHRRHSPYHRSSRDHRSRRSRSSSKSRSPSRKERERHKHSSRERDKEQKEPPQIIPIVVPVPADYAYRFPGWTTPQSPWPTMPHHRPPTAPQYASFPMMPMMPPLRAAHQTPFMGLHPQIPYGPMPNAYPPRTVLRYPTPRHNTHNYHPRHKKPST